MRESTGRIRPVLVYGRDDTETGTIEAEENPMNDEKTAPNAEEIDDSQLERATGGAGENGISFSYSVRFRCSDCGISWRSVYPTLGLRQEACPKCGKMLYGSKTEIILNGEI